jgi:uncharacterized protein (DUF4213/DUF364 family)
MSNFLIESLEILKKKLSDKDLPKIKDVIIGRKYLAVLLEGYLGTGYAPRRPTPTCTVFNKAGKLQQEPTVQLAEYVSSEDVLERAIGVACLNALTQFLIDEYKEEYYYYTNYDVLKYIPVSKDSVVGMVGRIGPFINFLNNNSRELIIIDDNPAIPKGKTELGYTISRSIESLEEVDILVMTGSTVIEHSLEGPLNAAKNANFKIVVGPTASWIPDKAFELGLNGVCGMKFKEPEKAFRTIMQGGGTILFAKYAEKYIFAREPIPNIN